MAIHRLPGAMKTYWLALALMVMASGTAANAELRFLAFPLVNDQEAGVTAEDTFARQQVFLVVLQHFAAITDYDPEEIWVRQAFMSGLLTTEDLHYSRMSAPLALKFLQALSYDPATRHDAAFWGTHTRNADDEDALTLTVVDLQTSKMHSDTITDTDGMLNELASVFLIETVEQMREGESVGSDAGTEAPPVINPGSPPTDPGAGAVDPPAGPPGDPPVGDPGEEPPAVGPEGGSAPPSLESGSPAERAAAREGWALIAQAQDLSSINQYEQALEVLRPFESLGVTDPQVLFRFYSDRGQYWLKVDDQIAARADLERAMEYAGPDAQETISHQIAQLERTQIYSETLDGGKWDVYPTAAIEEHLMRSNPRATDARWALVKRYMGLQPRPDWRAALKHLEALSLYLPNHPQVMREMARCYIGLDSPEEAVRRLEQWRSVMPHSFDMSASLLLADALVASRRADEAVGIFWDAIQGLERMPRLTDEQYASLFRASEAYLATHMPSLADAVQKSLELFSKGESGLGVTREELRTRVTDARPLINRLFEVLDAIRPAEPYVGWRPRILSGLLLLQQAMAETVYALDASDRAAGARAFEAWGLAMDEFEAAVEAARSATDARRAGETPAESTSPGAVIGL